MMSEICPICDNTSSTIIAERMRDAGKKVFYCDECDVAFKEGYADDVVDTESETSRGTNRFGTSRMSIDEIFQAGLKNQAFNLDVVNRHVDLQPDYKVLEVGCSSGYFLHSITDKVAEVYGIDLDEDSIDYAKRHFKSDHFYKEFWNVCLPIEFFDVIFCFQVLEHQADPKRFTEQLLRYLKPGGQLCLSVPNLNDALYSVYSVANFKVFSFSSEHLVYYTKKSILKLMATAGVDGEVIFKQAFSLNNAFSWIYTGEPMPTFEKAVSSAIEMQPNVSASIASEINSFMEKTAVDYKQMLERLGLSTSLFFIGRKSTD